MLEIYSFEVATLQNILIAMQIFDFFKNKIFKGKRQEAILIKNIVFKKAEISLKILDGVLPKVRS